MKYKHGAYSIGKALQNRLCVSSALSQDWKHPWKELCICRRSLSYRRSCAPPLKVLGCVLHHSLSHQKVCFSSCSHAPGHEHIRTWILCWDCITATALHMHEYYFFFNAVNEIQQSSVRVCLINPLWFALVQADEHWQFQHSGFCSCFGTTRSQAVKGVWGIGGRRSFQGGTEHPQLVHWACRVWAGLCVGCKKLFSGLLKPINMFLFRIESAPYPSLPLIAVAPHGFSVFGCCGLLLFL